MYLPVQLEPDLHLPRRIALRVVETEIGAAEVGIRRTPGHAVEQVERLDAQVHIQASGPEGLADTQILVQVPETPHVAVDARRIAQLANRLKECGAVQESVDCRVQLGAGNRRPPGRTG